MTRIVVIGGGVIGLACAYELRKRGEEVIVLDQSAIGAAASWGNAGWIVPSLSGPVPEPGLTLTALRWLLKPDSPLSIKPQPNPDFIRWLWEFWRHCNPHDYAAGLAVVAQLNQPTMELFDAWQAEGVPFEMYRAGLLFAFLGDEALQKALNDVHRLEPYGYDRPALLTGIDVRVRAPILSEAVIGGFIIERERHVEPATLISGLAGRLASLGTDLRTGVRVTGFQRRRGAVVAAETERGRIEGDSFVLAGGAWSATLAHSVGFRLPVCSGKGYSITIERPRQQLALPVYLDEAKVAITPFDHSLRLAGTMELSGLSSDVNPRRLSAMRRASQRFLSNWPAGESEIAWSGMRPLTPDGLPVLGQAPGADNVFVATGHGMLGVTLAPATARALANLIVNGSTATDLKPFDPGRFQRRRAAVR